MQLRSFFIILVFCIVSVNGISQIAIGDDLTDINYSNPKKYEIGGITITGVRYLDNNVLIMLSGLVVGEKIMIPGDEITEAIHNLWDQGLFENIRIIAQKTQGDIIFLEINLVERARLSKFSITGVGKSDADNLRDEINLVAGDVVTENLMIRTENAIKNFYWAKGFLNTEIEILREPDTARPNHVILNIDIDKNNKVKIYNVNVYGNDRLTEQQVEKAFKNTKEKSVVQPLTHLDTLITSSLAAGRNLDAVDVVNNAGQYFSDNLKLRIFKTSKYIEDDYKEDKLSLIKKYNELGYRDAKITKDSTYKNPDGTINVDIYIDEGNQYYFRNITWVGNTKFSAEQLNSILRIRKGDIYNQEILNANLNFNPNEMDVSSLYLDDGYLFFQVDPVEVAVESDSIDIEMRVYEGKQATINIVSVRGNTRTNDHVIIREIRTKPGELFNRSDIIRTTRELAQLRYFDPEKLNPVPMPNPVDGTVDIMYEVEETSSDQVELSGGWGYGRVIGTLGVSFNNFSLKNILDKGAWRPVPTGDGQKLSIRIQSYGRGYISYNFSFTEPWLGGKKPNSFTVSYYHSLYSNGFPRNDIGRQSFTLNGLSFVLGKRLSWPDDFFTLVQSINLQRYDLKNYTSVFSFGTGTGTYNNFTYGVTLARNSVDAPIFARSGSQISLGLELTPPYSLFSDKDYQAMPESERYQWVEYHKWEFKAYLYKQIVGNLVVALKLRYGFLGMYNSDIGITPFERYFLGGDGLSGYNNMDGREIIGFRGYANESLTPYYYKDRQLGGTIFCKNTLEFRYPLSLNPNSTIYALAFLETGNSWIAMDTYQPFNLYRSAGFGVRVFLPMFGLLGLDWGYGIDPVPGMPNASGSQFHFSINSSID